MYGRTCYIGKTKDAYTMTSVSDEQKDKVDAHVCRT